MCGPHHGDGHIIHGGIIGGGIGGAQAHHGGGGGMADAADASA